MPVSVEELNRSTSICFSSLACKNGLTPIKLIKELSLIAFSDPANHAAVDEGGAVYFKTFDEQGQKRRAIKSMKEKTVITESKDGEKIYKTSTVEYQLWDKLEAINSAMALHGMKKPKEVKLSGTVNLAEVLNAARERSNAKPGD